MAADEQNMNEPVAAVRRAKSGGRKRANQAQRGQNAPHGARRDGGPNSQLGKEGLQGSFAAASIWSMRPRGGSRGARNGSAHRRESATAVGPPDRVLRRAQPRASGCGRSRDRGDYRRTPAARCLPHRHAGNGTGRYRSIPAPAQTAKARARK